MRDAEPRSGSTWKPPVSLPFYVNDTINVNQDVVHQARRVTEFSRYALVGRTTSTPSHTPVKRSTCLPPRAPWNGHQLTLLCLQIKNTGDKTLRYLSVVSEPPISINTYKTWETCDDTVCKDENQILDDTEAVSPTWWDRRYAAAGGYDSYMRRVRKAAKKQAEEARKAEL